MLYFDSLWSSTSEAYCLLGLAPLLSLWVYLTCDGILKITINLCAANNVASDYLSNDELTFELNQIPGTLTEVFTSASTLVLPTIVIYVDNGVHNTYI